jgi:hypothetical protein
MEADVHEVPVKSCELTVKSAAVPVELATSERREPLESVTTLAVTPRLAPLIELARSCRVSPAFPEPVLKVAEVPFAIVIVIDEVGSVVVALELRSEYHDPSVARLFTTTEWDPVAALVVAVAVT